MELWLKMIESNPEMAGSLSFIAFISAYVCVKTVLWWFVFGTIGLCRDWYTFSAWFSRTKWGILGLLALAGGNGLLWVMYSPGNEIYENVVLVLILLGARIMWREFFTVGGIARGDWGLDEPNLRFFAWNTFLHFNSSLKVGGGSSSRSEEYDEYKDINPCTYYVDDEAMAIYAQSIGYTH